MDSKRTLSEISHLFLSEVRGRQGSGAARPVRVPPPKSADVSIDMSPEEFEAAFGDDLQLSHVESKSLAEVAPDSQGSPRVSVILASHLGERAGEGIRRYARWVASSIGRVGLIELDGGEFNLTCFESNGGEAALATVVRELDGKRMAETLSEMAVDVNRWLIFAPNSRGAEAREMIRLARHWVLLTLAGDEGIVATYRSLKGLAELGTPRLSLAVLDAADDAQATAVFRKLDAVSRQFLGCAMESESPVRLVQNVTEHPVLLCRSENKGASGPQWRIVSEFLGGAAAPEMATSRPQAETGAPMKTSASIHGAATAAPATSRMDPAIAASPRLVADEAMAEVIELSGDGAEGSILEAVIRQGGANGQWVQCPLKAPMCPRAALAVGRDRRLILLALAGKGLTELRSIGLGLRWMSENRELIRMALPQLNIDADAMPSVRLLVDHADVSAEALQPMLQSETVTVHVYRRLKWGQNTGLLLEAA
jgi:hypothetical protein